MQRPLIRIVDDDKALAGSFGLLLETMGWDTAAYTSGRRFLNNDDLSRPGCIVLDVRMPGLTESVETMHRDRLRARFETLTAREREIIGEILKGDGSETNKQIARTFDLELSTVKMHRSNAFMKLGVHSAAELIRLAQEAGIHAEA